MSKQRGMHGIRGSEGGKEKRRNRAKDREKENSGPFVMSDSILHSHDVCLFFLGASVLYFSGLKEMVGTNR